MPAYAATSLVLYPRLRKPPFQLQITQPMLTTTNIITTDIHSQYNQIPSTVISLNNQKKNKKERNRQCKNAEAAC